MSDADLLRRLQDVEAVNVERTRSGQDRAKIGEAICAFANDLADRREPGVLFVGANDDGSCANATVDDALLLRLTAWATDGTINPLPQLNVRIATLGGCRMAVVEVRPSENPPVKYDGRVCVRRGPRRGFATAEEERRLTEKRRWGNLPFDQQPLSGTSVADLDLVRFRLEFLPSAVSPEVLEENHRDVEDQLRALRFLTPGGQATALGLLMCGKDALAWLPGAYVQFVRYLGTSIGDSVRDEKTVTGVLPDQFRFLDEVVEANIERRSDLSSTRQEVRPTYPVVAVQELLRNALIHRSYDGTSTPVRLTWYDDRIEIVSPGGPYGHVTQANFGMPGITDYRNPGIAEAAKALGYVQRFGSGIARATTALARNGNPPPIFEVNAQFVHVRIGKAP